MMDFKMRTGDDEPEIPVLPEYLVSKIGLMSGSDGGTGTRSGKVIPGCPKLVAFLGKNR